jgi:putative membrane protein
MTEGYDMKTGYLLILMASTVANVAFAASKGDGDFVTKAAQGGMEEVALGRMASNQAASADVKQFGQRMMTDHAKANEELKAVAEKSGTAMPQDLSKKQQADEARLAKLNGAAFDKAYMTMMVSDHEEDIAEFEKEATSGKDVDVKAFAAKTLPTLKEHLSMAREAQSKVASTAK